MSRALKQAWWAPVAGLLVLAQLLLAVSFAFDSDDAEEAIVGVTIALGGALLLVAGLWRRPTARGLGNALIIVGAVLAAVFFWTLVMPVGAVIVVVGVVTSELRSPAPAAQTP